MLNDCLQLEQFQRSHTVTVASYGDEENDESTLPNEGQGGLINTTIDEESQINNNSKSPKFLPLSTVYSQKNELDNSDRRQSRQEIVSKALEDIYDKAIVADLEGEKGPTINLQEQNSRMNSKRSNHQDFTFEQVASCEMDQDLID